MQTVFENYFIKNCHHLKESELNENEQSNLAFLNEFFDYLMEKYLTLKEFLFNHQIVHLPLCVVTNQYNHVSLDKNNKQILMTKPYLISLYFSQAMLKSGLYELFDYLHVPQSLNCFEWSDQFHKFLVAKINHKKE